MAIAVISARFEVRGLRARVIRLLKIHTQDAFVEENATVKIYSGNHVGLFVLPVLPNFLRYLETCRNSFLTFQRDCECGCNIRII